MTETVAKKIFFLVSLKSQNINLGELSAIWIDLYRILRTSWNNLRNTFQGFKDIGWTWNKVIQDFTPTFDIDLRRNTGEELFQNPLKGWENVRRPTLSGLTLVAICTLPIIFLWWKFVPRVRGKSDMQQMRNKVLCLLMFTS